MKINDIIKESPALLGKLPSKKEKWSAQVHGDEQPKKSQKPGVLNQKHPFQGRLVGGT